MQEAQRRTGRPGREPTPGERVGLSLRVTPDTKRRLDAAATEAGRSLSQEAEFRLERSFERQDLVADVLELAYGPRFAGILVLLAEISHVGRFAGFVSGKTFEASENWLNDPFAYDQAVTAANLILEGLRPRGDPRRLLKSRQGARNEILAALPATQVVFILEAIRDPGRDDKTPEWSAFKLPRLAAERERRVREMLGPLIDRLSYLHDKKASSQ
jgi:TraY domain-containing protein